MFKRKTAEDKAAAKAKRHTEAEARKQAYTEKHAARKARAAAELLPKLEAHLLPGESLIELFEGTLGSRYMLTSSRLIDADTTGRISWAVPLDKIDAMDFDGWGDLHVSFGGKRHKVSLVADSDKLVSSRHTGERLMALIAERQGGAKTQEGPHPDRRLALEGNVRVVCPCGTSIIVLPSMLYEAVGEQFGIEGEVRFRDVVAGQVAATGDRLAVADAERGYTCPVCERRDRLPPADELLA